MDVNKQYEMYFNSNMNSFEVSRKFLSVAMNLSKDEIEEFLKEYSVAI